MDGGILEKRKAEEIKAEVHRRKRERRRRRNSRGSASGEDSMSYQPNAAVMGDGVASGEREGQNSLATPAATQGSSETCDDGQVATEDTQPAHARVTNSPDGLFASSPQAPGYGSDLGILSHLEPLFETTSEFDPNIGNSTWQHEPFFASPIADQSYVFDFGPAPLPRGTPLPGLDELLDPSLFAEPEAQKEMSTDPQLVHYVEQIIPNILPFITQETRETFRTGVLMPQANSKVSREDE